MIAESGAARTLELTPGTTVHLLDAGLRADLDTYLALLNANHSEGVRHLTLTDRGSGSRELRVSFLSEVPVWKSTYRLLITDAADKLAAGSKTGEQTATLQGYSVVDNTTGEDWKNVQLSLIAGSPQSFLQPLAQPIYSRRQEIPIAENVQLTPQVHESAITMLKEDGPPQASGVAGMSGFAGGSPGGVLGGMSAGKGAAIGPGSGGNIGGGIFRSKSANQTVAVSSAPLLPYETVARNSTVPNVATNTFDDFFAYNLTEPVSIPRNGSALVPILQTQLPSDRVTLWSPAEVMPLRALWLTNTSALTLDRGSFSVVENGAFAGEGLFDTIHPGERRLVSYAADQAVRVTADSRHSSRRVTTVSVSKGVLHAENAEVADVDYTVSNAAPVARTVVVEEPRRQGWTLDSDTKAAETTPSVYRFRLAVPARESVRLHVAERRTLDQLYRLTDASEEQLTVYLRDNGASPAVLAQLQPVFAAKRRLAGIRGEIATKQQAIAQLVEDQKRLRDNLAVLKASAEERSLVRRYTAELNTQEDTLAGLRRELAALEQQQVTAEAELAASIDSLHIETKI